MERRTTHDDKLVLKNSGKIFTLRGDVLKMLTDYKYNSADSPDARIIIDIMEEMQFDLHARRKS